MIKQAEIISLSDEKSLFIYDSHEYTLSMNDLGAEIHTPSASSPIMSFIVLSGVVKIIDRSANLLGLLYLATNPKTGDACWACSNADSGSIQTLLPVEYDLIEAEIYAFERISSQRSLT